MLPVIEKFMQYDWEKIFNDKSDKELYDIFVGKTLLNQEAIKYAEDELKQRNFNFDNIEKHRKKWELESLINEIKDEKSGVFMADMSSKQYLIGGIIGSFLLLIGILNIFFNFIEEQNKSDIISGKFMIVAVGVIMTATGLIGYFLKQRKEKNRDLRIKTLMKEI
jgi:hypothetical protein